VTTDRLADLFLARCLECRLSASQTALGPFCLQLARGENSLDRQPFHRNYVALRRTPRYVANPSDEYYAGMVDDFNRVLVGLDEPCSSFVARKEGEL
jgi:hypothetical protein